MKLKKVMKASIGYPTKEGIKPLIVGVGIAMAISSCSTTKPTEEPKTEIEPPVGVAGGVPAYIPPVENSGTKANN